MSSTEMELRKPVLKSSLLPSKSQRPRWKPTCLSSSQEPGPNSTSTTLEKSISPNPTLSSDLSSEDSTNSFLPQDHSPTSPYEQQKRNQEKRSFDLLILPPKMVLNNNYYL